MSVTLLNQKEPKERTFTSAELQVGVLYKFVDALGSEYATIYTKSLQGSIVWFEEGRVGVYNDYNVKFRLAPAGTTVTLSN